MCPKGNIFFDEGLGVSRVFVAWLAAPLQVSRLAPSRDSYGPPFYPSLRTNPKTHHQVGLPADPKACSNIVTKYQALLDRMAGSDLPATAQYRVDVEKIAQYRIEMATKYADDPDMVEELCQCGQVEELVQQADEEMQVLDMYLKERLWEAIEDSDVEIEYNPDPSKDGEGLDDDE